MSLLNKLFKLNKPSTGLPDGRSIMTSGELITQLAGGKNLVDGKQVWDYAGTHKHDIECMKECCDAALKTMEVTGFVAAPYYFERVAILSRKQKDYQQEIYYCENYINSVECLYEKRGAEDIADVRKGPRYQAILKRLPKARELLSKSQINLFDTN